MGLIEVYTGKRKAYKLTAADATPRYYMGYDPSTGAILDVGLATGALWRSFPMIESPAELLAINTPLEAILLTGWAANLQILGGTGKDFDLHAQIVEAGRLSDYDDFEYLDFLVLLGARSYPDLPKHRTDPENPTVEPPARPGLHEYGPDYDNGMNEGEYDTVCAVVQHLGLLGFVKRLYKQGGIHFSHLVDFVKFFFPIDHSLPADQLQAQVTARGMYINELNAHIRDMTGGVTFITPMLSINQIDQLWGLVVVED